MNRQEDLLRFKLRNGAAVLVNNKVKPGNNPTARPENS